MVRRRHPPLHRHPPAGPGPVAKGQSKDHVAKKYLAGHDGGECILFVGVAKEKARVWRTSRRRDPATGKRYPWLYQDQAMVNHWYFYGFDADFGPFYVKFCGYFPYTGQIYFNGHEYAKRQCLKAGIAFTSLDNAFGAVSDAEAVQRICDGLTDQKIYRFAWQVAGPAAAAVHPRRPGRRLPLAAVGQAGRVLHDHGPGPALAGRIFFEQLIRDNLDIGRPDKNAHTPAVTSGVREWRYELRSVADEKICSQSCEPFRGCHPSRQRIGRNRSRPDLQPHHPPPLRYLPVSLEAELLEQVGGTRMEVGTALRGALLDLLGVGLDEPTSSIVDGGQRGAERRPRNPTAPVPASGEDATDPPVGQLAQAVGIGFRVVDVRKLDRRPVLAPADAFTAVVNENLVHRSVANVGLLCQTVPRNGMALADALRVETHAPAAAPDPVVSLHQTGKLVQVSGLSGRVT